MAELLGDELRLPLQTRRRLDPRIDREESQDDERQSQDHGFQETDSIRLMAGFGFIKSEKEDGLSRIRPPREVVSFAINQRS